MLWASAQRAGVKHMLSEDLACHGSRRPAIQGAKPIRGCGTMAATLNGHISRS
jgi:hypothetical protein